MRLLRSVWFGLQQLLAILLDLVALGLVVLLLRLFPTPLSVLQGRGPLPHSGGAACS